MKGKKMDVLKLRKVSCILFIVALAFCGVFLVQSTAFAGGISPSIDDKTVTLAPPKLVKDSYKEDNCLVEICNPEQTYRNISFHDACIFTFNVPKDTKETMIHGTCKEFCANTKVGRSTINWISYEKDESNNPILKVSAYNPQQLKMALVSSTNKDLKPLNYTRFVSYYNTYTYNVPVGDGYDQLILYE